MSTNKAKAHVDTETEQAIESAISTSELFLRNNAKIIIASIALLVLIVGGFFGYKHLVAQPKAETASAQMFIAEQQFARDSFALALKGDGNFKGFEAIASEYGSTPAGNIAKHYAGVCYLHMGQYEDALKALRGYKEVDGAPGALMNAQNFGLRGDAYSQLENYKEAAEMYKKAASVNGNSLTAPYYLKKAGLVYEKLGENAKALEAYKAISTDYPSSLEARDVQKFIGRLSQK